jgi:hypothetical protein
MHEQNVRSNAAQRLLPDALWRTRHLATRPAGRAGVEARAAEHSGVSVATRRHALGTQCHPNYLRGSRLDVGGHEGNIRVQSAGHGPETTGRHHRVETPPALTETGRHRLASVRHAPEPTSVEPARRRHAADAAPATHPDARVHRRSRAPRRVLTGAALLAIAVAPVLARSTSGLGMHDAVAAELAAHPDQTDDTLEALRRGGILAGSLTPTSSTASVTTGIASTSSPTASSSGGSDTTRATSASTDSSARSPAGTATAAPGPSTSSDASASSAAGGSSTGTPVPTSGQPTGGGPTGTETTATSGSADDPDPTPTESDSQDQPTPVEPEPSESPDTDVVAPQTTDATTPTGQAAESSGNVVGTIIATLTGVLGD